MKYKADISLEQRQAVLAALLEIGDINIISVFMPVLRGSDLERRASQKRWWKAGNPSAKALVQKQAWMQKPKSESKTVAFDLRRQL